MVMNNMIKYKLFSQLKSMSMIDEMKVLSSWYFLINGNSQNQGLFAIAASLQNKYLQRLAIRTKLAQQKSKQYNYNSSFRAGSPQTYFLDGEN